MNNKKRVSVDFEKVKRSYAQTHPFETGTIDEAKVVEWFKRNMELKWKGKVKISFEIVND